jgi:hypothetical protein
VLDVYSSTRVSAVSCRRAVGLGSGLGLHVVLLINFLLPYLQYLLLVGQVSVEVFQGHRVTVDSCLLLLTEFRMGAEFIRVSVRGIRFRS